MDDVVTNRNCLYQTAYHVVWCPKSRRAALAGPVAVAIAAMFDAICTQRRWPLIAKEVQPDHIHLLVSIPPAIAVADAIKVLKGTTARWVFERFPALKRRRLGGHLWSPSYYVGTTGEVSPETIRRFIERSAQVTKRR